MPQFSAQSKYIMDCCAIITGCATSTIFISFMIIVILFDLICLVSTFYGKDVYKKCPESNLINFVIFWLVVPYIFLNKGKVIYTIKKIIKKSSESEEIEQQNEIIKEELGLKQIICSNMIFYLMMFMWGISELKISCVNKLHHSIIYFICIIITIICGLGGFITLILLCCTNTRDHIKQNPQDKFGKYSQLNSA